MKTCSTRTRQPLGKRLTLREVRRGLARGRGIAPDRHGRFDERRLERERASFIRRSRGAVVRVRVARVTHELRHLLASSNPNRRVAAGP